MAVSLAFTGAAGAQQKTPVPDADAQAEPRQLVRDVYGDKYRRSETPAAKTALAREMLEAAARDKEGSASQFVLLKTAREVAAEAGDAATVLEAVDRTARTYDVNDLKMKAEALQVAARNARLPGQRKAIAKEAYALVSAASDRDDYETAGALAELAVSEARKAREHALAGKIAASMKEVQERQRAFAEYEQALAVLEKDPAEPAANLAAGRYLCLVKQDWDRGIAMLALGSDPQLKAMAVGDLKPVASADEQVARGDGWWELAQTADGRDRQSLMLRAGHWYGQAEAKLPASLAKAKVEKRLQEIAKLETPSLTATSKTEKKTVGLDVVILKAIYGVAGREKDVTGIVREAFFKDPFAPIQADDRTMGDPAPGQQKKLALAYRVGRQMRSLQLSQSQAEVIPQIPGEGIKLRDADRRFAIVAARYGAGLTWLDITPGVARLATDPTTPFACGIQQAGRDPWFGIQKSVAIWFDYQGKRYVRVLPEGRCVLLP